MRQGQGTDWRARPSEIGGHQSNMQHQRTLLDSCKLSSSVRRHRCKPSARAPPRLFLSSCTPSGCAPAWAVQACLSLPYAALPWLKQFAQLCAWPPAVAPPRPVELRLDPATLSLSLPAFILKCDLHFGPATFLAFPGQLPCQPPAQTAPSIRPRGLCRSTSSLTL